MSKLEVANEDSARVERVAQDMTSDNENDIVGHKTIDTGMRDQHGLPIFRHEPLTRAEGEAMWKSAKEAEQRRAEKMPDERAAINALWDAHQRLKELGWKEPSYCPKDGSPFKVIELGSTGIFDCAYQGEWPHGLYMVSDENDVYPTSIGVAMFKLLPADEEKHKERLAESVARIKVEAREVSLPLTSGTKRKGRWPQFVTSIGSRRNEA